MPFLKNQINREARGFLRFFRAKVGGKAPDSFEGVIRPTVDVFPFTATSLLRAATTTATGNPPANLNIPVPTSENWLVYSVSLDLYSPTPLTGYQGAQWVIQLQGVLDTAGAVTDINLAQADMNNQGGTGTSVGGSAVWTPGQPLVLRGGYNLQGQYQIDDTSGNYVATLSVLYTLIEN